MSALPFKFASLAALSTPSTIATAPLGSLVACTRARRHARYDVRRPTPSHPDRTPRHLPSLLARFPQQHAIHGFAL